MDPSRLLGTWEFHREVRDHLDGTEYVASGEATFTPEADGRIRWAEEGTLRWADRSAPVSRTLFLVRGTAGAATSRDWRVTFEDGRDFHPWTARPVEHVCGPDLYQGTVATPAAPVADPGTSSGHIGPADAAGSTGWTIRWDVTGPAKGYTMVTRYSRLG